MTKLISEQKSLEVAIENENEKMAATRVEEAKLRGRLTDMAAANSKFISSLKSLKTQIKHIQSETADTRKGVEGLTKLVPGLGPAILDAVQRWRAKHLESSSLLLKNYAYEVAQRRYYFNRIQELKGNESLESR